jgi:hypothetical protein
MELTDGFRWRKSTFSGNGGDCVETGQAGDAVLLRDTKQHGHGHVHRFTTEQWREFIAAIKTAVPVNRCAC